MGVRLSQSPNSALNTHCKDDIPRLSQTFSFWHLAARLHEAQVVGSSNDSFSGGASPRVALRLDRPSCSAAFPGRRGQLAPHAQQAQLGCAARASNLWLDVLFFGGRGIHVMYIIFSIFLFNHGLKS